jgi:hypothetical protein
MSFIFNLALGIVCGCFSLLLSGCETVSKVEQMQEGHQQPWHGSKSFALSPLAFEVGYTSLEAHANYLSLVTPFLPVLELKNNLEKHLGRNLLSRGEAHITVITPPEFDELKAHLSMQDIQNVAVPQSSFFDFGKPRFKELEPVCVGRGLAQIDSQQEETYFVVVKAESLLDIRRRIFNLYVARGGDGSRFSPDSFFPHITIGFTKSDIHEQQGVKKGINSCLFRLH